MNDKEYYARLRMEMEHIKQHRKELEKKSIPDQPVNRASAGSFNAAPAKRITRRNKFRVTGEKIIKPSIERFHEVIRERNPITDDDILNVRIAAETSDDVLDFIRKIS